MQGTMLRVWVAKATLRVCADCMILKEIVLEVLASHCVETASSSTCHTAACRSRSCRVNVAETRGL